MGLDFKAVFGVILGVVGFFILSVFWVAIYPVVLASGIPALHLQILQFSITIFVIGVLMNFLKRIFYNKNNSSEGFEFN